MMNGLKLLLTLALLWAVPAGLGATDDLPVKVVGKSRQQIDAMLTQQGMSQPFCWQHFFEQTYPEFMGRPYGNGGAGCRAGTTLVNTETVDCVTFIENMMALALSARELARQPISTEHGRFLLYLEKLLEVRYYGGLNCTWEDRIHYWTDALRYMGAQGWLQDIGTFNGQPYQKPIYYISSHRRKYPGFDDWGRILHQERRLTHAQRYYYPLQELERYEQVAQTGDILGLTTNIDGLDVSHTGFAEWVDGELFFIHASSRAKKVVRQNIWEYLGTRTSITGVVAFRPTL